MFRVLRVCFRVFYLFLAFLSMLVGLMTLNDVYDASGTLPGGGSIDFDWAITMVGIAILMMLLGAALRMRAAHWFLTVSLLVGICLNIHALVYYPVHSGVVSPLVRFTPSPKQLHQVGAVLVTLFLLATLLSARSRRVLRRWCPALRGLSCPETARCRLIRHSYLGVGACLLLGAWALDLYRHIEISHEIENIFRVEGPKFFVALLGFLMLGVALAFRIRGARRVLAWSLVVGMALSSYSLRFLTLNETDTRIAWAPIPDHVFNLLLGSAVLLSWVVFSSPVITRAVRCEWWRIRRRFF